MVVVGAMPANAARARVAQRARVLPLALGRAVTALALADYREGSTLRYGELAGLIGPAITGTRAGVWVDMMLVDDATSLEGGHRIWNVPKQLAAFEWSGSPPESVAVHTLDGTVVVSASWSPSRRTVPLPLWTPFYGGLDGNVVTGHLAGVMRAGLTQAAIYVPSDSPLSALGIAGSRRVLVGEVRMRARGGRKVT